MQLPDAPQFRTAQRQASATGLPANIRTAGFAKTESFATRRHVPMLYAGSTWRVWHLSLCRPPAFVLDGPTEAGFHFPLLLGSGKAPYITDIRAKLPHLVRAFGVVWGSQYRTYGHSITLSLLYASWCAYIARVDAGPCFTCCELM